MHIQIFLVFLFILGLLFQMIDQNEYNYVDEVIVKDDINYYINQNRRYLSCFTGFPYYFISSTIIFCISYFLTGNKILSLMFFFFCFSVMKQVNEYIQYHSVNHNYNERNKVFYNKP